MKILLLAPHPFFQQRGTPLAVRSVLEFLSSRGHAVDILTFAEGEDVVLPNCRIYRIPKIPGIRNIKPGFSIKKLVSDVVMLFMCLRMVQRKRYDLIHAVEESAFMAATAQAITGVPYIYDMDSSLAEQLVDTLPFLRLFLPAFRKIEAFAVRHSLGVLTVCAALEDVALGHAPGKLVGRVEDTTLLPSHAQPSRGSALSDEVRGRGPVVMYVGNLQPYQGIDLLLEGFRHTAAAVPDASLVIVGGRDKDISQYQNRATRLGIGTRVHFIGTRPVGMLNDLFRQADVLVSPRLKGTNTPMKIYSYLDSGTAVLATRLPTHTQVLDEAIAYLVPPEPEELGRGLTDLLHNEPLRRELAQRAKTYVQREFTVEAARRKLNLFYSTMEFKAVEAGARA